MPSFLDFVGGEARSHTAALVVLGDKFEYVTEIDKLFQELHEKSKAHDEDESYIVYLSSYCQNRLYTSVLAYMRGQRGDTYSICRSAVEAAINAFLMHRGILNKATFEEGGRKILRLYREVKNPQHKNYVPELDYLQANRDILTKWGSHAEINAIVFRITEGTNPGEVHYNFFENAKDPGEYQFIFLCCLMHFVNVLATFGDIAIETEKDWGGRFRTQVRVLEERIKETGATIERPELFGRIDETPGG